MPPLFSIPPTHHDRLPDGFGSEPQGDFANRPPTQMVISRFPRRPEALEDPTNLGAMSGWHRLGLSGDWDVSAIERDFAGSLVYSYGRGATRAEKAQKSRLSLVFRPSEDHLVVLTPITTTYYRLEIWARSRALAQQRFEAARDAYLRKTRKPRGSIAFSIISIDRANALGTETVEAVARVSTDADLALHYGGAEFTSWNEEMLRNLKSNAAGVSLLRGEPGTGKTTYLRYLLLKLRATHRFYYLPLSVYPYLASPIAVGFWTREISSYSGRKKVVILEDAESLLMSRANDNQERLSNLLNLSDGFLGDFLRLHVICTINAPVQKLDPAILRPGRLLAYREFGRLTPEEAKRLAAAKGKSLVPQPDYSLAEIYASAAAGDLSSGRRVVGFSRNAA